MNDRCTMQMRFIQTVASGSVSANVIGFASLGLGFGCHDSASGWTFGAVVLVIGSGCHHVAVGEMASGCPGDGVGVIGSAGVACRSGLPLSGVPRVLHVPARVTSFAAVLLHGQASEHGAGCGLEEVTTDGGAESVLGVEASAPECAQAMHAAGG